MNRSIFNLWKPNYNNKANETKKIKTINLNFGPQHPAAHGVLRLILQLNGEVVEKLDPHIGLLHRGSEKLIESKNYLKGLPYFDRFDYCSMMTQEHTFCLALEKITKNSNYSSTTTIIRTMFDEITRIINHLLAIACHALDVGSMSSVFWGFEEREKLMEFYERVSGARMHAAYYRPNEITTSAITNSLLTDLIEFNRNFYSTINEMHNVLTYNKIWKQRLINIGTISKQICYTNGLTGVMSRGCGIKRDIRLSKKETYANYYCLNFKSYTGIHGDSYDRFLIRMNEMIEATNIINQCVSKIKLNSNFNDNKTKINKISSFLNKNKKLTQLNKNNYNSMENLISHFKNWNEGTTLEPNFIYQAIESPKGEFGVTLLTQNSSIPYKCKIKSPAYMNLQFLNYLARGHFLADLVTLIGTIDIVFGEIDR